MRSPNSGGSGESSKYRGVRKRKWGKWVSEVRLPNSRQRIWLGSYDSAEKAACAFDAAIFCLRSPRSRGAHLNFPGVVPQISCPRQLTHQQIRAAAARHALSAPPLLAVEVPTRATTPVVSETESEEAVVSDDWLLSDLAMNDLWYNFMEPTFALDGARDWVEPEVGDSVFGTSSFLWNF